VFDTHIHRYHTGNSRNLGLLLTLLGYEVSHTPHIHTYTHTCVFQPLVLKDLVLKVSRICPHMYTPVFGRGVTWFVWMSKKEEVSA
jgi:hypothetical protein